MSDQLPETDETIPVVPDEPRPTDPLDPDVDPLDPNEPLDPIEDPSEPPEPLDPRNPVDEERLTRPAPGGPNDPGASASDENQADTPGYSGGGDGDPSADPGLTSELWDEDPEER